ncbi:MAG: hypothetical protein PWQ60_2473 [Thermoanaerobacteraceae bacterium]|jgi:hypothetical protein|nr:hypothetical protein [Thermoanaerobacteraceae bacterium]
MRIIPATIHIESVVDIFCSAFVKMAARAALKNRCQAHGNRLRFRRKEK